MKTRKSILYEFQGVQDAQIWPKLKWLLAMGKIVEGNEMLECDSESFEELLVAS